MCLLSVSPPLLVELYHRKHNKLVLAVSFNLAVLNDQNSLTLPPAIGMAMGYDVVTKQRMTHHLKKLAARKHPMSPAFSLLAQTSFAEPLSESEGEWVAPISVLSVPGLPPLDPDWDRDDEADSEETATLGAVADTRRPRGRDTRWDGKLR